MPFSEFGDSVDLLIYFALFIVGVLFNCIPIFIASRRRLRQQGLVTALSIAGMVFWPLFFVALGIALAGETRPRPFHGLPHRTGPSHSPVEDAADALEEMRS